jgi:DNA-binding beta-propeller fold protein YncE
MNAATSHRTTPRAPRLAQIFLSLVALLTLTASAPLHAQTVVDTLGGGPSQANPSSNSGFTDGDTAGVAQFNQPSGLALDSTGRYLYVADTANNAVRRLDLTAGQTTTLITSLRTPVDVATDAAGNLYVLTQGDGWIRRYDNFGNLIATNNASALASPVAFALDANGNAYALESGSASVKFINATNRTVTTLVPVALVPLYSPRGIAVLDNGTLAISDTGNHAIRILNPITLALTTLTGLNGPGPINGGPSVAQFNSPHRLAKAGVGVLIVADRANQQLRKVAADGTVTVLYGLPAASWFNGPGAFPGWVDGTIDVAEARDPEGVAISGSGDVFVAEQFYAIIRKATGAGLKGPSGSTSSGGTGGGVTLNPPSLAISPTSGFFPMGQLVTVTSSSTNVFLTTDGTEPTTNSTALAIAAGTGSIRWLSATNDLSSLRVKAFVFSGTNSASTNVAGLASATSTIGVPPGLNATLAAGIGSTIVVPVVANLRTGDRLKSLQFRVEVAPVGAAPMATDQFRVVPISTNDFIATVTSDQSGAPAAVN